MVCHQNYLHVFSSMVNKSTYKEEPVTDTNAHLLTGNLSYKKYKIQQRLLHRKIYI